MVNLKSEAYKNSNCSVCFWSWNSDISEAEISEQLHDFAQGKINGVIIHSRAGLKINYLGKKWLDLFLFATETANELGLEVWIYDEDGWPSGFSGGKVPLLGDDYRHKFLKHAVFDGKTEYNKYNVVGVYKKISDAEYELKNTTIPEINDLVIWYEINGYYVDLLNPLVTKEFIATTHEVYKAKLNKYFGTTIKGVFTDEPQMNGFGYPWSCCLEEAFRNYTGDDLLKNLWKISVDTADSKLFCYKLWSCISLQYHNSFVKPIADWCEQNKLIFTGHFPCEDGLCAQLSACGDILLNYSSMQLPAIDHLGSRVASPILMKQVSSVSKQYGNGNVLSETFGCSGWGVDFHQLEWIWGGQAVLGVTKPCFHLSAYSFEGRRKRDYPAFFSYQEPWWDIFQNFNSWINNIAQLMTDGTKATDYLVVSPIDSIMAEYQDGSHDQTAMREISAQYRLLAENLLDLQIDFDISNSRIICKDGRINNGILTIGNAEYKNIILSKCSFISGEFAERLKEFKNSGGKIICINNFPKIEFSDNDMQKIAEVVLCNRRDTLAKYFEYIDADRLVSVCNITDGKIVKGIRTNIINTEFGYRMHIWPSSEFATKDVLLKVGGEFSVSLVDPRTNTDKMLNTTWDGENTACIFTVHTKENYIIDFKKGRSIPQKIAEVYSEYAVLNPEISFNHDNCYTVDYARYSINGSEFSEKKPIIEIIDDLYSQDRNEAIDVVLKYSFVCDKFDFGSMKFSFEDLQCDKIMVNDKELLSSREGWWIDKCMGVYSIEDYVQKGENIITLYYTVPSVNNDIALDEAYENEKNRFFYPIEPESIYIIGKFDVIADGEKYDKAFAMQTEGAFKLVAASPKSIGNLTEQNMWFYRGNTYYSFSINKPEDDSRVEINATHYSGSVAVLNINGNTLFSEKAPFAWDITDYLTDGENSVIIELFGNNRNLLGPHHYVNGESFLVGPSVFAGKWDGLTEFMLPNLLLKSTWTDRYGFIGYGIKKITVSLSKWI